MTTEIRVPTLGESVTEATVAQWLKKEGDAVDADEVIAELETDKVSVEVRAPAAGTIEAITVPEGDTVEVNALLGQIAEGAGGGKGVSANGAAAPAASGSSESGTDSTPIDIEVPTLGESVSEATVGSWLKQAGEAVEADEVIAELETDKVSVEVRAPAAGTLSALSVEEGATVAVGTVLGQLTPGGGVLAGGGAASPAPSAPAPSAKESDEDRISPAVRRVLMENNLDPATLIGTGKDGRLTKEDALKAAEAKKSGGAKAEAPVEISVPKPAPAPGSPVKAGDREERVPMTRLRQTIARRLKEAQDTAAMLTTFNEVDMTHVMALRNRTKGLFEKKHGVKLGFMSFFVKACIVGLKDVPSVNAEIDGKDLVYKNYYDIGVAVGTDKGLVVPVVRDADGLSLAGIEKKIGELGKRARDGALKIDELQGGTFTISNGGIYGSLMSTPILNAPQSGILGMHKIQERPVVVDGEIKVRPMMYLALSYDHRIIDGKEAVTFLVRVKESLEDPERMLLDL